jgi:hypothetical protein
MAAAMPGVGGLFCRRSVSLRVMRRRMSVVLGRRLGFRGRGPPLGIDGRLMMGVVRRHRVVGMIRRRRGMLRMIVRFGGLLRQRRRQQNAQRQREGAETTAAPARTHKVAHLIL